MTIFDNILVFATLFNVFWIMLEWSLDQIDEAEFYQMTDWSTTFELATEIRIYIDKVVLTVHIKFALI